MNEWSDASLSDFRKAMILCGGNFNDDETLRAALTAADAVRKREEGRDLLAALHGKPPVGDFVFSAPPREPSPLDDLQSGPPNAPQMSATGVILTELEDIKRRLTALETARQPEPPKPEPERRCGTCRWWRYGFCEWMTAHSCAAGVVIQNLRMKSDEGTDCPTWEARP